MRGVTSWLLFLLILVFAVVLVASWYSGLEKEWIAALLTAAVSVLGLLYTASENSRRRLRRGFSPRKRPHTKESLSCSRR